MPTLDERLAPYTVTSAPVFRSKRNIRLRAAVILREMIALQEKIADRIEASHFDDAA